MFFQKTLVLGMLLGLTSLAVASERVYAPLPERVQLAKTVYFVNASGTARFGDDLYREIRKWNRWDVVADKSKADLILVLSPSDTIPTVVSATTSSASANATMGSVSGPASGVQVTTAGNRETQHWHLYVVDGKTGENLWRSDASMGGKLWRSWGSIARSLLSDIQKRVQ